MNPNYTIKDIADGLASKEFSAEEIFSHYLNKIGLKNKRLNAYLSVFDFPNSKFKIQNSKLAASSLSGVPCAVKDNILIEGTVATAGSKILENYVSAYDATIIERLKKAGVQFLGKTNMDEFAMGSSTENSAFGPTRNPHDHERIPGGSSGGSAAAVAADLCVFSIGSDTGGSIRQPASFCGVVGLKPTYGRVSRHGLIAMASSLDQIGSFTKNTYDAALVLNVLAGNDRFDSTTVDLLGHDFTKNLNKPISGLKVGIPKEYFNEGLSAEVRSRVEDGILKLKNLGCDMVDISLPHSEYALAAYYIIMPSEISSNLARFDGIRYGHSTENGNSLLDVYSKSRAEGFGSESKRRIMLGTYALSSGYYDAYYLKAEKVRALIKKDFDDAFRKVDVIVGPTAPTTAFKIGDKSSDPLSMYLSDIYTVPVNLAGLPGISISCGKGNDSNMPVGFQIIGKSFDEETILRVAHQLEQILNTNSMAQIINIFNIDIAEILFRIKLVSFIFSGIFLSLGIYFMYKFQKLITLKSEMAKALIRPPESAFGGASQSRWEEIARHIESASEAEWKLAVIEADNLVDSLLKSAGFVGDTMGERLTNMEKGQLLSLEELWEAHKIRNKLVHDVNYFLRYGEAKRAVGLYRQTLEELGGI